MQLRSTDGRSRYSKCSGLYARCADAPMRRCADVAFLGVAMPMWQLCLLCTRCVALYRILSSELVAPNITKTLNREKPIGSATSFMSHDCHISELH